MDFTIAAYMGSDARPPDCELLLAKAVAGTLTADEAEAFGRLLADHPDLRKEFRQLCALNVTALSREAWRQNDAAPAVPIERLRTAVEGSLRSPAADHMPSDRGASAVPGSSWINIIFRLRRLAPVALVLVAVAGAAALFLRQRPSDEAIGFLVVERGPVQVHRRNHSSWRSPAGTVYANDILAVPEDASATLVVPGGSSISLVGTTNQARNLADQAKVRSTSADGNTEWSRLVNEALLLSPERLDSRRLLLAFRGAGGIPVYSPRGTTAYLEPTLIWKAEPNTRYSIRITDELDPSAPPWRATEVLPPLGFTNVAEWRGRPLATNGLYRLRILPSGSAVPTEITFRTTPVASQTATSDPAARLQTALEIIRVGPERIGDALGVLLTLPTEYGDSELGTRLKMLAFGHLGLKSDFEAAITRLGQPPGQ